MASSSAAGPFRFRPDTADSLKAVLDTAASVVIPHLEDLAREYRAQPPIPKWDRIKRDVQQAIRALQRLAEHIDGIRPMTIEFLCTPATLGDLVDGADRVWVDVLVAQIRANEAAQKLEARIARPLRLGARRKENRHTLAFGVGLVLHLNGIPVTASRDGIFGKVLATVLEEVEPKRPRDLFPVIQPVASLIKEISLPELRRIAEMYGRIYGRSALVRLFVVH